MKKIQLGNGGPEVSVCLGTMMMGSKNTEEESIQQLDYFVGRGGNFLDTAEIYAVPTTDERIGQSERFIGRWMAARGNRSDLVLATKVCGPIPHNRPSKNRYDPPNPDAPLPRHEWEQVRDACEGSLRRLQTNYIDIFYLHWPDRYVPLFGYHTYDASKVRDAHSFEEIVKAMGQLIKQGKIRHWALSNETAYGITMMCETAKRLGEPLPVCLQNDYSLTERYVDLDVAEALHIYNIKLVPYGVLGGGYLSGKYLDGAKPQGRHTENPNFQPRYAAPPVEAALLEYRKLAAKKGISLTTLAVAWACSRWHVGQVITGQTSLEQLKEYLDATETQLDQETLDEVDRIHRSCRNPTWSD